MATFLVTALRNIVSSSFSGHLQAGRSTRYDSLAWRLFSTRYALTDSISLKHAFYKTKFRDRESVGLFHNNVYLLTCQSASLQSAFVTDRFPRRRYVGHSLIWTKRVCAAEQGMVFRGTDFLKTVQFYYLASWTGCTLIGAEALRSSVKTDD